MFLKLLSVMTVLSQDWWAFIHSLNQFPLGHPLCPRCCDKLWTHTAAPWIPSSQSLQCVVPATTVLIEAHRHDKSNRDRETLERRWMAQEGVRTTVFLCPSSEWEGGIQGGRNRTEESLALGHRGPEGREGCSSSAVLGRSSYSEMGQARGPQCRGL